MPESTEKPKLGQRFQDAMAFALEVHQRQLRKGTRIPYVSHLLAVASLVLEDDGDENEAMAALLHDAVEDQGGAPMLDRIGARFGEKVRDLVEGLSDSIAAHGHGDATKEDWRVRKERYLEHLEGACASARRITAADKLHNCRALVTDLRFEGPSVWKRFNAGKEDLLWYYKQVSELLSAENPGRSARLLRDAVRELEAVSGDGGPPP